MKKFTQLLEYIKQQNIVASEKIDCFVTDCQLQLSGKSEAQGSIVAAYKTYTAVYDFENVHGSQADRLLTHFASWVYNHDQSESGDQLEQPNFDIEPVTDTVVDVTATVQFEEKIQLQQNDDGEYQFGNQRYSLNPPVINTAESVEVDGEVVEGGTHG